MTSRLPVLTESLLIRQQWPARVRTILKYFALRRVPYDRSQHTHTVSYVPTEVKQTHESNQVQAPQEHRRYFTPPVAVGHSST